MKNARINRALSAAVLLGVIALTLNIGPAGPFVSTTIATQTAAAVSGFGFWETLGCIGCIAGFVIGAGTTIAGLAVFLAANPEIGILCLSTCTAAAT